MDDDQWDASFLDNLTEEEEPVTQSNGEEEEFNVPPPTPKLQSFKEAIQSLDDIKVFLEDHGHYEQASTAAALLAQMASSHSSTMTSLKHRLQHRLKHRLKHGLNNVIQCHVNTSVCHKILCNMNYWR